MHFVLRRVSIFLDTYVSIPCTWLRFCVKSCDGCFFHLSISLGILAKMLLSLVFWNWLAVMPRRSIFAVLVRWLGISWAVATDSVWSRQQCMIYFRWLMLGQCHNLHSLSSQLANFLDDRLACGCRPKGPCLECSIRWPLVCQNDLRRKLKAEFAKVNYFLAKVWRK